MKVERTVAQNCVVKSNNGSRNSKGAEPNVIPGPKWQDEIAN